MTVRNNHQASEHRFVKMKLYHECLIISWLFIVAADANDGVGKNTCGYNACHPTKADTLNVHLVPHTHDDVGWLKTLDQYYYGSRTSTQQAGVQYILDSVIDELVKDTNRRFVYVETAFFERWWSNQNEQKRLLVKKLVSEGRFEFAGGAWSMNDEATTHYQSVVDQFTWGLRFLNDTFGECGRPNTVWQIDPFGHSREMANIWALSGYDGLFLGRIDFQDKRDRLNSKTAEMIWRGSNDDGPTFDDRSGKPSDLFTGVLYNNYAPPPGFCFDVLCDDDPIIDDINSPDYNVDKLTNKFVQYARTQADHYKTNNIIMTMGEDFFYQNAPMWYKNLDKLIKYVNRNVSSINLMYSTPSCYLKALHDSNQQWPTEKDDFFPYASDEHSYWTGYYTSRPNIKYFERRGNNILQVCKQLYSLTKLNENNKIGLNALRRAMGVMQHHDAITGTEQQHVAYDYARILQEGIQYCVATMEETLNKLMSTKFNHHSSTSRQVDVNYLPMSICQLNITECKVTETSKKFVVTIYNPLAHIINEYIRLPVNGKAYTVKTATGDEINHELFEISNDMIRQLHERKSNASHELLFIAENLPPMGYRAYFIESRDDSFNEIDVDGNNDRKIKIIREQTNTERVKTKTLEQNDDITIGNEHIKITVDGSLGLINSITLKENDDTTVYPFKQELMFYSAIGNDTRFRASGAYIFRPNSSEAASIGKPKISVTKGHLVEEIHQRFSNWATQIIRVYKGQTHIEFEWLVGPIPIDDNVGKEIISRFTTNFQTNKTFYTDANGRQMIKRKVNERPTWNVTIDEPVAANYYPITTMISIKDNMAKKEMFVISDRAQGGTLSKEGQIDIMVHRRLLFDDHFGVEEALNETVNGVGLTTKGTHYLLLGDSKKSKPPLAVESRQLALKKLLQPVIFLSPANNSTFDSWNTNNNEFSGLHAELPANVHILTLEPWKDGRILLRLEHFVSANDDPQDLSKKALVNLRILFSGIKIVSYRETSLAANQWIENVHRLKWTSSENKNYNSPLFENIVFKSLPTAAKEKLIDYLTLDFPKKPDENVRNNEDNDFLVYLQPMEIKTFIIEASFDM